MSTEGLQTEGAEHAGVVAGPEDAVAIVECAAADAGDWDSFVTHSNGTYCHLYGWKAVFELSYRLRTLYLAFLRSGGEWVGILPLALMPRFPGRQSTAISLPYCTYGGILAAPGVDSAALRARAAGYLLARGVRTIEFRESSADPAASGEVCMILQLPHTSQRLWEELGTKVRNKIRKAQNSDLSVRWGRDQAGILYELYAVRMGELGTPVHSRRFVDVILRDLGCKVDIVAVWHRDRAVCAMLVIQFEDVWSDIFAASLAEFRAVRPNMLMYWEALKAACDTGAKQYDFGRSQRGSGTYDFKKQWGAQEGGLNYFTFQDGALKRGAATDFYRGDIASALSRAWMRLPSGLQRKVGPAVRRWVP